MHNPFLSDHKQKKRMYKGDLESYSRQPFLLISVYGFLDFLFSNLFKHSLV